MATETSVRCDDGGRANRQADDLKACSAVYFEKDRLVDRGIRESRGPKHALGQVTASTTIITPFFPSAMQQLGAFAISKLLGNLGPESLPQLRLVCRDWYRAITQHIFEVAYTGQGKSLVFRIKSRRFAKFAKTLIVTLEGDCGPGRVASLVLDLPRYRNCRVLSCVLDRQEHYDALLGILRALPSLKHVEIDAREALGISHLPNNLESMTLFTQNDLQLDTCMAQMVAPGLVKFAMNRETITRELLRRIEANFPSLEKLTVVRRTDQRTLLAYDAKYASIRHLGGIGFGHGSLAEVTLWPRKPSHPLLLRYQDESMVDYFSFVLMVMEKVLRGRFDYRGFPDLMKVDITVAHEELADGEEFWKCLDHVAEITVTCSSLNKCVLPDKMFRATTLGVTLGHHFTLPFLEWVVSHFPALKRLRLDPAPGQPEIASVRTEILFHLEKFSTTSESLSLWEFVSGRAPNTLVMQTMCRRE